MWDSQSISVSVSQHMCVCHYNAPLTPIPSPTAGHKAEFKGGFQVRLCVCANAKLDV